MRKLGILIGLLAVAVGSAVAQSDQAPAAPFDPVFETQLSPTRHYPLQALQEGVAGIVHLCCEPRADRTLACEVGVEWPRGHGFAEASQRLVQNMRISQASVDQLHERSVTTFRMPIRWQIAPAPPALDDAEARIDATTADLCGPGTGRAAPSSYIVITASPAPGRH